MIRYTRVKIQRDKFLQTTFFLADNDNFSSQQNVESIALLQPDISESIAEYLGNNLDIEKKPEQIKNFVSSIFKRFISNKEEETEIHKTNGNIEKINTTLKRQLDEGNSVKIIESMDNNSKNNFKFFYFENPEPKSKRQKILENEDMTDSTSNFSNTTPR